MTRTATPPSLPVPARLLVGAFLTSGVVHLLRPRTFEALMPAWVPAQEAVVQASGAAELVCAVAMVVPATRRAGGWASAALLVGVFPGNVEMARRALRGHDRTRQAVAVARLPLQVPLVRVALRVARS